MSEQVADRIRRLIHVRGPLTFADYMNEALYGPEGFYRLTRVGTQGDFVTSPHVHPVFSRLVGMAMEELWAGLQRPVPFRLVEAGAGDGTLARELLDGFARGGIEVEFAAVEMGPEAREALAAITPRVATGLAELDALEPGVILANELLDNLPFRRVRRRGDGLMEIRIGLQDDRLAEIDMPCDAELAAATPELDDGAEAVVPVGAFAFVEQLARSLRRGYALLIDYGTTAGPAGEVHGYRRHRVIEDVLADPGSADVTAGVDLGAVAERARESGLAVFGAVSQRQALVALGFDEWMRLELARQGELLNAERGVEATRTWAGRNRARLLADPSALGRLQWLLLATPGVPEPDWFDRARTRQAD